MNTNYLRYLEIEVENNISIYLYNVYTYIIHLIADCEKSMVFYKLLNMVINKKCN